MTYARLVVNALVPVNNRLPSYWEESKRLLKSSAPAHMHIALNLCKTIMRSVANLVVRCGAEEQIATPDPDVVEDSGGAPAAFAPHAQPKPGARAAKPPIHSLDSRPTHQLVLIPSCGSSDVYTQRLRPVAGQWVGRPFARQLALPIRIGAHRSRIYTADCLSLVGLRLVRLRLVRLSLVGLSLVRLSLVRLKPSPPKA